MAAIFIFDPSSTANLGCVLLRRSASQQISKVRRPRHPKLSLGLSRGAETRLQLPSSGNQLVIKIVLYSAG